MIIVVRVRIRLRMSLARARLAVARAVVVRGGHVEGWAWPGRELGLGIDV